jgi:uncharacterized membrane protein
LVIDALLIYLIISVGVNAIPKAGIIVSLIIAGPFSLGHAIFALSISRNQNPSIELIFQGFNRFGTSIGAYFLNLIFVLLWSILLIIPGIIAALSYSLTFYLIADDDSLGPLEAIDKSKKMMDGNKMKLFRLVLRFVGLILLCVFTLGIGLLWVIPFIQVTMAKFYEDVKSENLISEEHSI